MRVFQFLLPPLLTFLLATGAVAAESLWKIDPAHSSVQFKVRHMMISNVKGSFRKLTGSVNYDGKDLKKASVTANIEASSIDTQEEKRDEHLRGADFLDTDKFPAITFKSKKIKPSKNGNFGVTGDLTIHGVTKEVTLAADSLTKPINDPWGKTRMGATAHTTINRKNFGVNFNKTLDSGGAIVGDDVHINLEIELVKEG